jgi:hypothetical protein
MSVPLTFYTHARLRCHRVAVAGTDDPCNVHTMQASYQQPTSLALQDECADSAGLQREHLCCAY